MPAGEVSLRMTGDEAEAFRALAKVIAQQKRMEDGFGSVRRSAKAAGRDVQDAFGGPTLSRLTSYAAGVLSITSAISKSAEAYRVFTTNIRESANEAQKASRELITLALLQEGGASAVAVQRALALGTEFGITARGEVLETVQALQSVRGGNLEAGLAASRSVFAAAQVGMELLDARELELLGASQGQAPGMALRRAFIAGELSTRGPRELARAAPAFRFFDDKDVAFAVAGVILGSVSPEEIETYVKAAGIGFSGVSADKFQKTFKRLGVDKGNLVEKALALRGAGITTPEQLARAGLAEIRQQQAVSTVIQNIDDVVRFAEAIRERSQVDIIGQQRRALFADVPLSQIATDVRSLQTLQRDMAAAGPHGLESLAIEREQLLRGAALRKMGIEQILWFDAIDEMGRASQNVELLYNISRALGLRERDEIPAEVLEREGFPRRTSGLSFRMEKERERLFGMSFADMMHEFAKMVEKTESAARELSEASGNLRPPTTLAEPDVDR